MLPGTMAQEMVVGMGDDAAVYRVPEDRVQVVTTDLLTEDVHFLAGRTTHESLGFKAIAVNASDVLAMNALPLRATVALALPEGFTVEDVEALYRGIRQAAADYGIDIVGGDTTASKVLTLAVTMIGEARETDIVCRSGAREGDILAVTCDLGAAYAGLQVLLRGEPSASFPYVTTRLEWPRPPIDVVRDWARRHVLPSALIDISDGPVAEIGHICRQSGCGARIVLKDIPIAPETRAVAGHFGDDPAMYALYGGDEYGLLFAVSEEDYGRMDQSRIHVIGRVTAESDGMVLETEQGDVPVASSRCFSHFARLDS